jgi:diguanylate cyclase (GGDEF)-like protein/PAS domain S-box-containing protein
MSPRAPSKSSAVIPPLDGALLAAMVDSLQDYAILMLDPAGAVVSWNVGTEQFKGWGAEEIIGRDHSVFYPAAAIAAGTPAGELDVASTYGRFEEQAWRVRRDGSRFWANVVITAVRDDRDDRDEVRGYGVVIRDVTDHYAAMQALRQSEARFRSVTESATDAIIAADSRGRIVSWNLAAARLYGYPPTEAIGQPVTMLVPERNRARTAELLRDVSSPETADRMTTPIELTGRRQDGVEIPVEVSIGSWQVGDERHFSGIVRDITERKRIEGQLQYLADHDSLTGLYNRRRFESELERMVAEAARYERRAALLVLDLDGFKEVNDHHGHSAGDEVIAKVGALLAGLVRDSDIVARLGGDEFGVIIQEADRREAEFVAEKIIDAVRSRGMVVSDLVRAHVTASIGITLLEPGVQAMAEELLVEADRAMYDAKSLGRNAHAFHAPVHGARSELNERRSWLKRLRHALDHDLFELHAQPIVSINGSGCARYELLLRMRDEETGELLVPGAFLQSAERFDLIGGIDRWVLNHAVTLLHAHHRAGNELSLTVNLSGKTMNDLAIVDDLRAMMDEHPVPPGRLVVEVTETAAIVNINRAADLARDLRELGCDFALDDFGSGFASFYYLKHLEFDYLKIDGEFIARLVQTQTDQLVVRAVVDIARGLGSQTIAEFVGDDETVSLLHDFGVDYGQGYHLGRPEPLCERLPTIS